jgi:hypothetical protein
MALHLFLIFPSDFSWVACDTIVLPDRIFVGNMKRLKRHEMVIPE